MISAIRARVTSRSREASKVSRRWAQSSTPSVCRRAGGLWRSFMYCSIAVLCSPMRTKSARMPTFRRRSPSSRISELGPVSRTPPAGSSRTRSAPAHAYHSLPLASSRWQTTRLPRAWSSSTIQRISCAYAIPIPLPRGRSSTPATRSSWSARSIRRTALRMPRSPTPSSLMSSTYAPRGIPGRSAPSTRAETYQPGAPSKPSPACTPPPTPIIPQSTARPAVTRRSASGPSIRCASRAAIARPT